MDLIKNKKIASFYVFTALIILILAGMVYYSVSFMSDIIESTSEVDTSADSGAVKFNLDKLKEIGIIKE